MPLDGATAKFLTELAAVGGPPPHERSPAEVRLLTNSVASRQPRGPAVAGIEDILIGPERARFMMRVIRPLGPRRGIVVYYHGGGWVLGDLAGFEPVGRALAQRTGCVVVLVDYRLAPEHPYPAAVDDAWEALLWAAGHRQELAGSPVPVVVAGDSAGGNLAAVTAQRAHAERNPSVAQQILVYPATDCFLDTESFLAPENQLMVGRDLMRWFWDHYLPDPEARSHPTASPIRAADLRGLPPAEVLTAEYDVLRDEGEAYAERLRDAGVPVRLRRFAGQMHGFFTLTSLPGSDLALDHIADAVDKRLAGE